MRAIMVMFDSLNRHMLPPYGCDWTHTPNFQRLADRCVTFDNSYISSMPCMPARRELHTGRPNFLHRSWGPLEPFDDSVPQILQQNGTSSHLISDHYHYWETGGANYHAQYSTWQFKRGQEGDPWMGQVVEPVIPDAEGQNAVDDLWHRQDRINREFMRDVSEQPQSKTFAAGLEFVRRNYRDDNWFLQIETFDPHEPFFSHEEFKALCAYPTTLASLRLEARALSLCAALCRAVRCAVRCATGHSSFLKEFPGSSDRSHWKPADRPVAFVITAQIGFGGSMARSDSSAPPIVHFLHFVHFWAL